MNPPGAWLNDGYDGPRRIARPRSSRSSKSSFGFPDQDGAGNLYPVSHTGADGRQGALRHPGGPCIVRRGGLRGVDTNLLPKGRRRAHMLKLAASSAARKSLPAEGSAGDNPLKGEPDVNLE